MAITRKTDDVIALEHHMLTHCANNELRDELYSYFRRYPFALVDEIDESGRFSGCAHLDSGRIELVRRLADSSPERALHVYLHELAHIISNAGHTLDFASLAAGLQQRFRCRDMSRRSLVYDLHETGVNEWRSSEYAHLRRGGSVRAIGDPETWIDHRRASQEALAADRWRERYIWPNVAALIVSLVAVVGIVAWPWISALFSNEILTFTVGFVVAAGVILSALLSVNNT